MRRPGVFLLVAVLLAVSGCATREQVTTGTEKVDARAKRDGGGKAAAPVEDPAPDFEVDTFDGGTFSLAEQRGTPVVLNFWESW